MSDDFNMSMRKFLKQVGVTSQQAIEEALRAAETDGKSFAIKAVVTIEELDMTHEVSGELKGQE
ncbi:hypothetical protein TRP8649_00331 [Pelagimonas phthalicica]|uniref:Uncharacterized protein n=1 Tax=Pelagimonas phthalicica TaxID=1037362 RepID=A0A238J6I0_9RHOB|nr:DUF6494 family protein [Pelagimonas phthalicica]TDS95218.1 hypothetical protein CLV87_1741 [Pelagimonas phthalicica]SMX26258.1 hypothetical protein TRP8649_00331 [Pelagimonas phthalicica]